MPRKETKVLSTPDNQKRMKEEQKRLEKLKPNLEDNDSTVSLEEEEIAAFLEAVKGLGDQNHDYWND